LTFAAAGYWIVLWATVRCKIVGVETYSSRMFWLGGTSLKTELTWHHPVGLSSLDGGYLNSGTSLEH
jgi:hypothetical protein